MNQILIKPIYYIQPLDNNNIDLFDSACQIIYNNNIQFKDDFNSKTVSFERKVTISLLTSISKKIQDIDVYEEAYQEWLYRLEGSKNL